MEKENDFSLEMNEVNVDDVEELEAAVALGGTVKILAHFPTAP